MSIMSGKVVLVSGYQETNWRELSQGRIRGQVRGHEGAAGYTEQVQLFRGAVRLQPIQLLGIFKAKTLQMFTEI